MDPKNDPTASIFGDLDPLGSDAPEQALDGAQGESAPTPEDVAARMGAHGDPLKMAREEAQAWREAALRAAAELDNFRKRTAKEKQDAIRFANSALLETLLPILDNFEFGLQAAKAESEQSVIVVGMGMVQKQLSDFLREQGVEEIPAVGLAFDPNVHEAVSQQPAAPGVAEGTVLSQIRRGFRLRDRLLRPAMVVVAAQPSAPSAGGAAAVKS
jgi:molecular chaperone GrpE